MLMAQKEEEEGSSGHYSHRTSAIRETLRNLQQTLQCPIWYEGEGGRGKGLRGQSGGKVGGAITSLLLIIKI